MLINTPVDMGMTKHLLLNGIGKCFCNVIASSLCEKFEIIFIRYVYHSPPFTAREIRSLKGAVALLGQWSYIAGGMSIKVKGSQATRNEAPILVIAPHSTFLDSIIVYVTQMSSVIVRKESMDNCAGSK